MNKVLRWDAQAARNWQFDAQASMGFVVSQTAHIEAGVNMLTYPDIQYPDLIPVDTSAHPFAKTITYYSGDIVGRAKWINGQADDIPIAGAELNKHETAIQMAAVGYGYGFEELGQAMMLGYPLTDTDAKAARRAYEEFVDGVAFIGDTTKNFAGFINNALVTPVAATFGDWGGTGSTPEQIIHDFNQGIRLSWSNTNFTSLADTVLLPFLKLDYLASVVLPSTTTTLLQFIKANNTYSATTNRPLVIRGVRGLDTAGVGPTNRMIAYRRSPEVLKMHIPMPHRFLPAWQAGPLRIEVPGVFRLGGVDIRRPKEVNYIDGI